MLKYPILHSGFVALSETSLIKPTAVPPTFAETILFREKNRTFEPYFYSPEITTLFNEFRGDYRVIRHFEFRERILKQAFVHFGRDFSDWINFQSKKTTFSNTHRQFLETMVPWTQDPEVIPASDASTVLRWVSLLGPQSGNAVEFSWERLLRDRFTGDMSTNKTEKLITNWVSHEGGYESLLTYLFIIFGERTGHLQVNVQSVSTYD